VRRRVNHRLRGQQAGSRSDAAQRRRQRGALSRRPGSGVGNTDQGSKRFIIIIIITFHHHSPPPPSPTRVRRRQIITDYYAREMMDTVVIGA